MPIDRSRMAAALALAAVAVWLPSDVAGADTAAAAAAARAEMSRVGQAITAAIEAAGDDPARIVDGLPPEIRAEHEAEFDALLGLQPGDSAGAVAIAEAAFQKELVARGREHAAGLGPAQLRSQVEAAVAASDSGRLFQGHFLHPALPKPFGRFAPNCENRWCVPDLYIEDYDKGDLDGRHGNYCSVVPDLWFRWPCYQHDVGFEFAPMVAESKIGSFLAINWQWYGDMRTECHERIRNDWLNPEFVRCQVVALTYYVFVNVLSFPIFNEPNRITGYDVLDGPAPNLTHPPVYKRWNACTGDYTQSAPFVSYNRQVLSGTASVPRGAILELSGRAHRDTRLLFEFWDASGALVANHITGKAGDNCIVAQEPERFSTAGLSPGTYRVSARFYAWEGGRNEIDASYSPPRVVAHGVSRHEPNVLTLRITEAAPGPGGGGPGPDCPTKDVCRPDVY